MSNSIWFRDKPGRCLLCGKELKMKDGSGYCSSDCETKDTSEYERSRILRIKQALTGNDQ